MRRTLVIVALAAGLVLLSAAAAAAGGKTVRATLSGKCSETDKLDANGALMSTSFVCTASGKCACAGSTRLDYSVTSTEPGTGADGRESGTLTASGPQGVLTFALKGKHTSLGAGIGTWKLVKVSGYAGVKLVRRGTYTTSIRTVKKLPLSMDTIVKVNASLNSWLS